MAGNGLDTYPFIFRFFFMLLNEEEEKEIIMNVSMINDNELSIRFSDKNDDEVIAIAKAMRILEDVMAKETQTSKERLLAAIENSGDNYAKMKEFEYALELYKTNNENCIEIKNLIKVLSKAD